MKNIYIVLLLLISLLSVSQKSVFNIGELNDSIKKYSNNNPEKFIRYGNILEKLLIKKQQTKELILLKNDLARQSIFRQNYSKAIEKIDEAILLSNSINNDSLLAISYKTKGTINIYLRNFVNAINLFVKSDSLANNKRLQYYLRMNIATVLEMTGSYFEAIDNRKKLYADYLNVKNIDQLRYSNLLTLINDYKMLLVRDEDNKNKYFDTINHYFNVLDASKQEDSYLIDLVFLTKQSVYIEKQLCPNDSIIKHIDSIKNKFAKLDIKYLNKMFFFDKAKYYFKNNKYNSALVNVLKIDSLDSVNKDEFIFKDESEMMLSKIYLLLGDRKLALEKMNSAKRIIRHKEKQQELIALSLHSKSDQTKNNIISNLVERSGNKSQLINSLYLILVLAIVSIFTLLYRKKKIESKFKDALARLKMNKEGKLIEKTISKSENKIPINILNKLKKEFKKFEHERKFLDSQLNLTKLSVLVKSNRTYTSVFINEYLKVSFKDYLNNLRINYALNKLTTDRLFQKYSVQAIAEECGYNTAETFSKAFKGIVKLYPSQFIKQMKKENFK